MPTYYGRVSAGDKINFRVFDPLDFLAEVSAQIPDAHEKTTLFYGYDGDRRD